MSRYKSVEYHKWEVPTDPIVTGYLPMKLINDGNLIRVKNSDSVGYQGFQFQIYIKITHHDDRIEVHRTGTNDVKLSYLDYGFTDDEITFMTTPIN